MIKVFHGSDHIIKIPRYMGGKTDNDYGNGFYTTEYEERARSWATLNGNPQKSIVNMYQLDLDGLNILDLNERGVLAWIAEVVSNRGTNQEAASIVGERLVELYAPNHDGYDIIKGYRADDSYFSFAQDFINGTISYRQLNNAMYLGKLGIQYVLKSKEAFNRIVFDGYEEAEYKEWYAKKMKRDKSARREYFDVERNRRQRGDIYITQILDEEMSPDDKRLR